MREVQLASRMSSLVIVARFASRSEALIAQSLLRSEGIETLMPEFNVLMAELDPSMMEHGWRLMGLAEDAAHIETLLAEAARQPMENLDAEK
jgi:hypothetical protein